MSSPNSPPPATAPPPSFTNSTSPPPPPQSSDAPPPQSPSPPPPSSDSPPPQTPTPVALSPPPPVATSSPPPPVESSPPPVASSSPPPPVESSPPPVASSSPPPPVESSPPPVASSPPPSTTPPSLPTPSPPPPSLNPPQSSPAPPSKPPEKSPPPPPKSKPPGNSPPPPSPPSITPDKSPPSPPSITPEKSPPSPPSITPEKSPPSPPSITPEKSPPSPPSITPEKSPPSPPTPPSSSSPPPKKSPLPTPSPPPSPPQSPSRPVSSPPSLVSPPSTSTPDSSSNPPTSSSIPSPPVASNSQGIGTTGAVAIGVVAGFIVLGFFALAIWYWCFRKRRHRSGLNGVHIMPSTVGSSAGSDSFFTKAHSSAPILGTGSSSSDFVNSPPEPNGLGNSRPLFTHDDLVKATNGFSPQNLLGEGGFGPVYKGHLPDGRVVAVKQLKIGGGQGEREFKAEVETISRIHHRHLVSLVGYCISENQRLLVYDYVPNNTLYFHLHGKGRPVLDWARRVKIAVGAARGIAYLHEDCHPRIIHRDIKSSNILLDDNFDARVSDFGLAKIALDMYTHITTRVMGTFGYMAPEYASSGKLTDKSDVFSFGVVLLELITGRKPVDTSQELGDESLVEWARPLLSHALETENFEGMADPRLEGNYVESEMFRMIEAAAACVRHSAAKRPRMEQVARAFDSVAGSDLTNGMRPGQSEVFNSAQQSEEIRFFRRMAFGSQNYSTDFFSSNV